MEFLARYRWGLPSMMTIANDNAQAQITIVEVIRPNVEAKVDDDVQPEAAATAEVEKAVETNGSDVPF
jgi:hypothetical protein